MCIIIAALSLIILNSLHHEVVGNNIDISNNPLNLYNIHTYTHVNVHYTTHYTYL